MKYKFVALGWESQLGAHGGCKRLPVGATLMAGMVDWPIEVEAVDLLTAFRLVALRLRKSRRETGLNFRLDEKVESDGRVDFLLDIISELDPEFGLLP